MLRTEDGQWLQLCHVAKLYTAPVGVVAFVRGWRSYTTVAVVTDGAAALRLCDALGEQIALGLAGELAPGTWIDVRDVRRWALGEQPVPTG